MKQNQPKPVSPEWISTKETAGLLGISTASVTNWVRHGYLKPEGRNRFAYQTVLELQERICTGQLTRLGSRANKAASTKKFLPAERLSNRQHKKQLTEIINYIHDRQIATEQALYVLALGLLKKYRLLPGNIGDALLVKGQFTIPARPELTAALLEWRSSLGRNPLPAGCSRLLEFPLPDQEDLAGIIYQSLLREGSMAAGGSYYTPPDLASEITAACLQPEQTFLDPCCGTGQFLLAASHTCNNPALLYGADCDQTAVRLARLNLQLAYPDLDFRPQVECCDALLSGSRLPHCDVIVTNPPWGYHFPEPELACLKRVFPEILSGESFAYFLCLGLQLLKNGGSLAYVLPEALLNVKSHRDIRQQILTGFKLTEIRYLKGVFKHVFSPVIVLKLRKTAPGGSLLVRKPGGSFTVPVSRFSGNNDHIFDIHMLPGDEQLINKLYTGKHLYLKNQATWALGIVTGNNQEYLKPVQVDASYEPVYKGKDLLPFIFREPANFIRFTPEKFQQVAAEAIYRAPQKLIYKFISSQLVFALDTQQRLSLNSANILIPRIPGYPAKLILALFNSTLYQFLFRKRFASLKVLRSHLEQLPLPVPEPGTTSRIMTLVDEILAGREVFPQLDRLIFNLFNFSDEERNYIQTSSGLKKKWRNTESYLPDTINQRVTAEKNLNYQAGEVESC